MAPVPNAPPLAARNGEQDARKNSEALEPHFTLAELAAKWHLARSTIRDWFLDEPGVLLVTRTGRRNGKRTLTNMRIPQSVAERVHRKRVRR